jgi:hypothetical protein
MNTAQMTLNNYQAAARKTDRAADKSLAFPLLGLFGEVGTLLSVVKKKQREAASYIGYAPHVIEELGMFFGTLPPSRIAQAFSFRTSATT